MGKRRIAAVHGAPLRKLEVTPRGKNGGLRRGLGRVSVLGGILFHARFVVTSVVFPSCFIPGWTSLPRLVQF